jgi:hypothetical protein
LAAGKLDSAERRDFFHGGAELFKFVASVAAMGSFGLVSGTVIILESNGHQLSTPYLNGTSDTVILPWGVALSLRKPKAKPAAAIQHNF